jgi:dihydroorotase
LFGKEPEGNDPELRLRIGANFDSMRRLSTVTPVYFYGMTCPMTQQLTLTRPDDWHIHLRDGTALTRTVGDAAQQFARAIVMPNLVPPVMNAEQAQTYKERILAARPKGSQFEPLMVLYLTDNTDPAEIAIAKAAGVTACKLYPAGATTNSASGVTDLKKIYPVLAAMQNVGMPFLLHGEVTDSAIDIFDREKVFLDRTFSQVVKDFPVLKMVLEHITTADAAQFVAEAPDNVAATITAHHLLYNRNHMLAGGIRPHYYCLPILKRGTHQQALIKAATSGSPKFFLGTDSAPHAKDKKEAACGCAGSYTAYAAIELYAEAFEDAGALDKLEAFASHFGADFYGLPRNTDTITLIKQDWQVPDTLSLGDQPLVPLRAGEILRWQLQTA